MDHNHLLWDDTVAGPKPDHRNTTTPAAAGGRNINKFRSTLSLTLDPAVDVVVGPIITRSITILKPNSSSSSSAMPTTPTSHLDSLLSSSSVPSSPVGSFSSSPSSSSPFSPRTPQFDSKGLLTSRRKPPAPMTTMRNKSSSSSVVYEPRTPTVYDWVVISALDR